MSETPLSGRESRLVVEAIRKGEVDALVVSEQDRSERILVLRSADRLYRMMIETMGEGAAALSADGTITYCNAQFLALIDRTRDEVLGLPLRGFVAAESQEPFDAMLQPDCETRAELSLVGGSGVIPIAITSTPLNDEGGAHFCLVVHDLREQRAREQLRAAKEAAELANRAKDDFLAMVSHELRSPITVILGWTRLLQMNRVDHETGMLAIDNIQNSTGRLLKLVDDILDASRLQSGKVQLQMEVLDLRDSIRSSLEAMRVVIDQKPLQLTMELPDDPAPIVGDPYRVQQVVANLLGNAIKFTPSQGSIAVALRLDGTTARVHVRDSGEGIDASFLPYVFERFRQGDSSTTRPHRGLGLGLAIVKQLVEAHGGSVSAASDGKGKGAEFVVTLPLTAQERHFDTRARTEPLPALDGRRVLLVDDEAATREVMRSILDSSGAVVETASTVAEALERAVTFGPDVIVTDIAMPGEDGFDFLRRLSAPTPVIAITGKSQATDRDAILAAGFRRYLRKPIEPEELIRAVHTLTT